MNSAAIILGGYFATLVALSLFARRYRRRLAVLGRDLMAENLNQHEKQIIEGLLNTSYSIRSAAMLIFVYAEALLRRGFELDREANDMNERYPLLWKHPNMSEFIECHFVSVAAESPIFGALAYLLRSIFRIKARLASGSHLSDIDAQRFALRAAT